MDIIVGDHAKKVLIMGMSLILKKMGFAPDAMENDLHSTQNQVIRNLNAIILACSTNTKTKHHAEMIKKYGQFALWVMYKDTAYRDQFFWSLNQILEHAKELKPLVQEYVKDPQDWYTNLVDISRKRTAKLKSEDKIVDYGKSIEEEIFTPTLQRQRLEKINARKRI